MNIVESFSKGEWIFDYLYPPFVSAIEGSDQVRKIKGDKSPFFLKTALHYKVLLETEAREISSFDFAENSVVHALEASNAMKKLVKTTHFETDIWASNTSEHLILKSIWSRLSSADAVIGSHFSRIVSNVIPVQNKLFSAASSPHAFGALFLTKRWLGLSEEAQMVSQVHELAHQELFLVNLVDRLVNESSDFALAHGPLQGKQRPPIGRLHAAHALFRMRNFRKSMGWNFDQVQLLLQETCATLHRSELTALAFSIVKDVYQNEI